MGCVDGQARVGIRELRNEVAAVVRRAGRGERIVVTVDGVPVAQLGPLEPVGRPGIEDLVAARLVEPPRRSLPSTAPEPLPIPVDLRVSAVLESIRGEGGR